MGQQRLANIMCFKCGQKVYYRKDCGTSPMSDQTWSMPTYSHPTLVTTSFSIAQSSLATTLKELAKVKHKNCQLKNNLQQTPSKQGSTSRYTVTKPAVALKVVMTKNPTFGK